MQDERAIAGLSAGLRLQYRARDVYLVLTGKGTVDVVVDGKPERKVRVRNDRLYTLVAPPEARRPPARAALHAGRRGLRIHVRLGSRPCTPRPPTATSRCSTAAAAAAGCSCPRSRSASGTTSATTGRYEHGRAIARRAFDLGITHFDLANNYGPPYGSAEENFGRMLRDDLAPYRDELVISTKAGYDMWPGPYGEWGSRKYLLASLDQSLARMGLDYVDIFYSHRFDPDTPLEETMGALDTAVRQGKALYVGISSYSRREDARGGRDPARPRHAARDPPALVLDAEPLDRAGAARRARATRASAASPSRRSRRAC